MKPSQYLRYAIIFGVVIGGMFLLMPRNEALGVGATMIGMVATLIVGQQPAPKTFILGHRREVTIAGWTLVVLGLALALGMSFGESSDQLKMAPGMTVAVAGIVLTTLPRSLKSADEVKARPSDQAPSRPSAIQEGLDALTFPLRNFKMSSMVLGPWVGLFLAGPLVLIVTLAAMGDDRVKAMSRSEAIIAVWAIFAGILVMYGALMAAAIQWTRFIKEGRPPPFGIPWRPLWSFAWRWIVFGSLPRIADKFAPWLTSHAPLLPHWASVSVTHLAGLTLLTLASPFGLVLPALALREKDTSTATALSAVRIYGRRFYLGALLVLSPFALASWLLDLMPINQGDALLGNGLGIAILAVWIATFFVTVTAAMTYLTRVHLRANCPT